MTSIRTFDYDEMRRRECEDLVPRLFHVHLPVERFVCDDIEVGSSAYAMIFESGRSTYALIVDRQHDLTLADIKRIAKQMGLSVSRYFPPEANPRYFFERGIELYRKTYPARKQWSKQDIMFYEQQVVYSPALLRVDAINGLRRYSASTDNWQHVFDLRFRKVPVL